MREVENIVSTQDGAHVLILCADGGVMYYHNKATDGELTSLKLQKKQTIILDGKYNVIPLHDFHFLLQIFLAVLQYLHRARHV